MLGYFIKEDQTECVCCLRAFKGILHLFWEEGKGRCKEAAHFCSVTHPPPRAFAAAHFKQSIKVSTNREISRFDNKYWETYGTLLNVVDQRVDKETCYLTKIIVCGYKAGRETPKPVCRCCFWWGMLKDRKLVNLDIKEMEVALERETDDLVCGLSSAGKEPLDHPNHVRRSKLNLFVFVNTYVNEIKPQASIHYMDCVCRADWERYLSSLGYCIANCTLLIYFDEYSLTLVIHSNSAIVY